MFKWLFHLPPSWANNLLQTELEPEWVNVVIGMEGIVVKVQFLNEHKVPVWVDCKHL